VMFLRFRFHRLGRKSEAPPVWCRRASSIPAGDSLERPNPTHPPGAAASFSGRRRFYKVVSVLPHSSSSSFDLFTIRLDDRALRTPTRNELMVPGAPLAHALAAEWDRQDNAGIRPETMPLTSLAFTAVDQVAADRELVMEGCINYLMNDTACYPACPTSDRVIHRMQRDAWDPINKILRSVLPPEHPPYVAPAGELHLGALPHPPALVEFLRASLADMDIYELACLQSVTRESKSLLVGYAAVRGRTVTDGAIPPSPDCVVAASRVEEEFSIETWGLVEGGHDLDRLNCSVQIRAATVFLDLLREGRNGR